MPTNLLGRLHPLPQHVDGGFFVPETLKSGFIVFRKRHEEVEIVLLHRLKQDDWSFPKGHVEDGENLLEAGFRELAEEAYLQPMVLGALTDLAYLDGKGKPVRLSLFLGYTDEDIDPKIKLQAEVAEWVPLSKVEDTLSYENLKHYFRENISPLFKKEGSAPLSITVLFSDTEPYKNGAMRMTDTFRGRGLIAQPLELNAAALETENSLKATFGYFLTNHPHAAQAAFWLEQLKGTFIINREYLRLWHSKSQIQEVLRQAKVPTLPSGPLFTKEVAKNPFIIKSENHGLRDQAALEELSQISPWEAYIEQKMDNSDYIEVKFGYIAGRIFLEKENCSLSPNITACLHRIQEWLGLEVFSIDLFIDKKTGSFFVIDVNSAPAFFHNEKARQAFSQYLTALHFVFPSATI